MVDLLGFLLQELDQLADKCLLGSLVEELLLSW